MEKKWYQSKTLWVAILEVIIGVLVYSKGQLATGGVISTQAIIMIVLRLITESKVVVKK